MCQRYVHTDYTRHLISITSNTETTLTYSVQGFTPDATTMYEIQDTWGLLTASTTTTYTEGTTKNWGVNQWAGKRFKLTGGLGIGTETTCLSNTATVILGDAQPVGPGLTWSVGLDTTNKPLFYWKDSTNNNNYFVLFHFRLFFVC